MTAVRNVPFNNIEYIENKLVDSPRNKTFTIFRRPDHYSRCFFLFCRIWRTPNHARPFSPNNIILSLTLISRTVNRIIIFFSALLLFSVTNSNENWRAECVRCTLASYCHTFFPFMVHVKLADGYDLPTVHTALKPSVMATSFLSTCKFGSSIGSSTTCIRASFISVWNVGASSDTSQRNTPDRSRLTLRNVNVCESDEATCVKRNHKRRYNIY